MLDCLAAARAGCFAALGPQAEAALQSASLNALLALGRGTSRAVRLAASRLLREDTAEGRRAQALRETIIVGTDRVSMQVPADIGDFTDFYASVYHATNVGSMFRPDSPLLPNYKWVPIGYHGRASSIVANGTPVRGRAGRRIPERARRPCTDPRRHLDYELEIGVFVCGENSLGDTVPIARAEERTLRPVPPERLVRPRRAELGVPAARPLPREEFRHDGRALGRDARRAGTVPHRGVRATGGRPRTAPVPE